MAARMTATIAAIAAFASPALLVPGAVAQDRRIPAAEVAADREKANLLYAEQLRQTRQVIAQRDNTDAANKAAYDAEVERRRAEHAAEVARWQADVERQRAEYDRMVAQCIADKTCAPQ